MTEYFGTALNNENGAIPVIFSKKLALAYGTKGMGVTDNLTNDNYAGEIKQMGDRVRIVIPQVPSDDAIAMATLDKDGSDGYSGTEGVCPVFQSPAPEALDLVIDKIATFGLAIDDVQKAQTQFKNWLDGQATAYGEKLKFLRNKQIAQDIFDAPTDTQLTNKHPFADQKINAGGTAYERVGGTLGSPKAVTSQNIFTFLLKVKEQLIKSGAVGADGTYSFKPMEEEARDERAVLLVTPEMHTLIMSSYRVGGRSVEMADVIVKDGAVSRVAGMDVVIDKTLNQIKYQNAVVTDYPFIAGTKNAITKAQQISKVESERDPYCFRDLLKGIDLYGYKIVHPEALFRGCIAAVEPEEAAPVVVTNPTSAPVPTLEMGE